MNKHSKTETVMDTECSVYQVATGGCHRGSGWGEEKNFLRRKIEILEVRSDKYEICQICVPFGIGLGKRGSYDC